VAAQELQEKTAILPDYSFLNGQQDESIGTSISGIVGGMFTLTVTVVVGVAILAYKKRKLKKA
jgi:cobalt/nickel transport system permease protein